MLVSKETASVWQFGVSPFISFIAVLLLTSPKLFRQHDLVPLLCGGSQVEVVIALAIMNPRTSYPLGPLHPLGAASVLPNWGLFLGTELLASGPVCFSCHRGHLVP